MTTAALIRDAADPLAAALSAVQDLGLRVPAADIHVSVTGHGLVLRVADRSAAHRADIEAIVRAAFVAAGWESSVRYAGGLTLRHPLTMTRL